MAKQESWLEKKISRALCALLIAGKAEDYVSEDSNGNIVYTPSNVWHKQVFQKQR